MRWQGIISILIKQKGKPQLINKLKIRQMLSLNKHLLGSLSKANKFSYFIYLKDHNKKINPQKNRIALSYQRPNVVKVDAPKENPHIFNLKRKTQKQLERKMFEDYKEKVLKGQIDQDEEVFIDPLWGEGQKPKHFFQSLSKTELMTVSYSQSVDFKPKLAAIYESVFTTTLSSLSTLDEIKGMNTSQLVDAAVFGRLNEIEDTQFWHHVEKSIANKFYELTTDQLISLNFSLKGSVRKGTPRIHSILKDLFEEDLSQMSHQQLTALYYSLRNGKIDVVALQDKILTHLEPLYEQMNFQQKINWLLTYTIARRPQSFKQAHTKTMHENLRKAHQVLFNINFSSEISKELSSVEQCLNLVYSLAMMRAKNTKFIMDQILVYLKEHIEEVTSNVEQSAQLLFYLQELEAGIGAWDEELGNKLIETVTEGNNFASLSKIHQIKTVYAIWNYNLMNDDVFEMYKSIQIEADSTLLFYFCQIEMARSSEREWQVLRNLAELNHVPIPYYQAIKRFYHHMKVSAPEWDLAPIEDKLKNTEFYCNALRARDSFYHIKFYDNLQKYFKFSTQISPFEHTLPIQNLELTQFGNATYQVSVDIVNESAFAPGTNTLKESYRNKIRSLSNLGWKHIVYREKEINRLSASDQLQEVLSAFVPHIEEQMAVIQNRDYYRAEELENMRVQSYWDGMIGEEAEGYRNNPEEYAKKLAEIAEREKKLSEEQAKVDQ